MGCSGSSQSPSGEPVPGGPASTTGSRIWARGVGTAFEFLNDSNNWQPIVDKYVIDQLGRLCAHNSTAVVTYDGRANGQQYRTVQASDGMILQTNIATSVQRPLRLVPFFFEFEEGPSDWRPVVDPEALMSLTAVLASSINKRYTYTSQSTGYQGEADATLVDERGLIEQRNLQTQTRRRIRATPVGPDGAPHFEFLDESGWAAVSNSCVKQLAAVAVGRGDAFYTIEHAAGRAAGTSQRYHARLAEDGFIVQRNIGTGVERRVRAAPWLGHGTGADSEGTRIRADPTDGYYRGREKESPAQTPEPPELAAPIPMAVPIVNPSSSSNMATTTTTTTTTQTVMMAAQPAQSFYVPEAVPMGTMAEPVLLQEAQPLPTAQPIYYYQPEVMEPGDVSVPRLGLGGCLVPRCGVTMWHWAPSAHKSTVRALVCGQPGHVPMAHPVA